MIPGSVEPRRCAKYSMIPPAMPPPISPPRWPPIEIPLKANEITRLKMISGPMPLAHTSIPRARPIMNAAPKSPKIAPEAPAVSALGVTSSAPNEPHSIEAK